MNPFVISIFFMLFSFDTALQKVGAQSSTQIPSVVIDFPSAAEFSNLWGRDAPHAPRYLRAWWSILSISRRWIV